MQTLALSRAAGVTYFIIIALGLTAEFALRGPLIDTTNAAWTFATISENLTRFRLAILADAGMVLADVAMAVLLFALLRGVNGTVALTAMILRLIQAAVIAASALALIAAASLPGAEAVLSLVTLHAAGYDFGLIFFAGSTALTAWLLAKSGLVPRWLPPLLGAASIVYVTGSVSRIITPEFNALMQPAYLIPVIAETAMALVLLIGPRARAQFA